MTGSYIRHSHLLQLPDDLAHLSLAGPTKVEATHRWMDTLPANLGGSDYHLFRFQMGTGSDHHQPACCLGKPGLAR
jgi:hypothetical protein